MMKSSTRKPTMANVSVATLCFAFALLFIFHAVHAQVEMEEEEESLAAENSAIPGDPGTGDFEEDMTGFFQTLVRNRRQLPRRADEDKVGFTEEERQALLAIHNAHRSTVSPTAANMIEIRWNSLIEEFAQNWTDRCEAAHRPARHLGVWFNMGENIFWQGGPTYLEKTAVDFWWNEVRFYTFSNRSCETNKVCGHYITAAWATSEYIGCGIRRCPGLPGITTSRVYHFVCDYSGRFVSNVRPYEEGTSCSNCPSAYPRCRYNLCVSQDMLDSCDGYNGTTVYISATRDNTISDPFTCPPATQPPPTGNTGPGNQGTTNNPDDVATSITCSCLTLLLCLGLGLFFMSS